MADDEVILKIRHLIIMSQLPVTHGTKISCKSQEGYNIHIEVHIGHIYMCN